MSDPINIQTLLQIVDDFFFRRFFSLMDVLFDLCFDRPFAELAFSVSLIMVRGSVNISDKDMPGTAAALTNFSIDSAHKSRPR